MEIKGIDVSSYQGKPEWSKISAAGINFAILRIHQRSGVDSSFEYNYKGCKNNGILVGGYKYSYALTQAQALEEAEDTLATLNGRGLDFPVFYDLEWNAQRNLEKSVITKIAKTFLERMRKAGYKVGIYCNVDWYKNVLDVKSLPYDYWLASYPVNDTGAIQERIRPSFGVGWQYSSKGKISGISGNVDMNVFYKDYRNDPGKEITAVYTKSNAINRVIGIAQEEIGYLEKRSNSQLEDKTANAGSNNYTKYWRDVHLAYQGQPWCAAFVSWVLMQAFGKATATAMLKHWPYVYCPTLGNLFTKHANPEVGDIVIFYRGGTFAHTGIVTAVNGDKFTTIEGNTSGASGVIANGGGVCQKSYYNSSLPGTKFCRPDWSLAVNWMDQNLVQASGKDFLSLGDNGAAVRKLQEGLVYVGISVGKSGVDGDFGNDTQKAVKTFQARYGLEADGNAGPATQAKLKAEVYKTENAQKGFTRFVGEVQKRSVVHTQARKASPAIEGYAQLNKGNLVDVLGRDGYQDNWYKVCVADQYLGYVWAGNVKRV